MSQVAPTLSSDPDSKALKKATEALRTIDIPRAPALQRWLDGHLTAGPRQLSFYERKRAVLEAKKARIEVLMNLRALALKNGARRWPRLREARQADKENQMRVAKAKQREADAKQRKAAEAADSARERAAADARVAHLMGLRAKAERGFEFLIVPTSPCITPGDIPDLSLASPHLVPTYARYVLSLESSPTVFLLPTAMATIPVDVCWEIALASPPASVASLLQLSVSCSRTLRPALYQDITVDDKSDILVRSLATDSALASLVQSLTFQASPFAVVDNEYWAVALATMHNLRHLTIAHYVPLHRSWLPHITFRLRSFTATGLTSGAWATLLHAQPEIEEICFCRQFMGKAPSVAALPALRRVTGRVDDVAKFAQKHPLEVVTFWRTSLRQHLKTRDMQRFATSPAQLRAMRINAGHLITLFAMVPNFFLSLKHLALDEESVWAQPQSSSRKLLGTVASILNERRIPALETLTTV
ncbi:hypothetical protein B0H11DRAFT_1938749 [Mycena galericulata]|nr:hypothetical protein B0H11DRAFT_1938749 [Mycena galericulata]